jgi:hypothetical protein
MQSALDKWIDSLDDNLHLGEDRFGFVPSETVENHNAFFTAHELTRAGLNKLAKALKQIA